MDKSKIKILFMTIPCILLLNGCAKSADESSSSPAAPTVTFSPSSIQLFENWSASLTPTITGTISSCTVSPALPAGLSLNSTTCAISGTPTTSSAKANYTITATNSATSGTSTISIAVQTTTPSRVYGQVNFTSGSFGLTASTFNWPEYAVKSASGVYITDSQNRRVLYFAGTSTTATTVYGQSGSFTSNTASLTATGLGGPSGIAIDTSGNLWVVDQGYNRVLWYASGSTTATGVYGQSAYTTSTSGCTATGLNGPTGIFVDSTGVYIADTGNNRVVYYSGVNGSGASGPAATRIYGQPNATTCSQNTGGRSATSMHGPNSIAVNSEGVYVSENNNFRILFFPGTSTTATRVYGQADFTANVVGGPSATAVSSVEGIFLTSEGLYVTDRSYNRILFFPGTSTTATAAIGQSSLTTASSGTTATTLLSPKSVMINSGMWIVDRVNHRVLFYP